LNGISSRMKRLAAGLMCATLLLGLSGCLRKKAKTVLLPQSTTPVVLETVPPPANPPMVEVPVVKVPPVPVAAAASKPKRERRRSAKVVPAAVAPPVPVTAADLPTEGSPIGALTSGGDASPQKRQAAVELIASNERRLKALSADTVNSQRAEINQIRNFQRQAQEALDSGDAEGATTLATKAKLLLYDLDRAGG
jgi:hypothetical protein